LTNIIPHHRLVAPHPAIALDAAAGTDELYPDLAAVLYQDLENGPYRRDHLTTVDQRLVARFGRMMRRTPGPGPPPAVARSGEPRMLRSPALHKSGASTAPATAGSMLTTSPPTEPGPAVDTHHPKRKSPYCHLLGSKVCESLRSRFSGCDL
jgi:hypothetical protein